MATAGPKASQLLLGSILIRSAERKKHLVLHNMNKSLKRQQELF